MTYREGSLIGRKIIFRTDASIQIGSGHVMRCLNLAETMRFLGATCHFICRAHLGNLISLIIERGFQTSVLPAPTVRYINNKIRSRPQPNYSDWLGVEWHVDAYQTKNTIGDKTVDLIIVDHYAIDANWEKLLQDSCFHLVVIDDIANRQHSCNFLLDQNYEDIERYKKHVNQDCLLLLGPRYALLSKKYKECRNLKMQKKNNINRIFVFFGNTDFHNTTEKALKALSIPALIHLNVEIVIGVNYQFFESLNKLASSRRRVVIHKSLPDLAELMNTCDLAIGAGGVCNWERICVGLPSLVIAVAENQVPISEMLHSQGIIKYLGEVNVVSIDSISGSLLDEIQLQEISNNAVRAMNLCDGLGVDRVISEIISI